MVQVTVSTPKRGACLFSTYPVEACMQQRKDGGLFMVTRSAEKQKMWSLSSYRPGFIMLKPQERATRQEQFSLASTTLFYGHTRTHILSLPSEYRIRKGSRDKSRRISESLSPAHRRPLFQHLALGSVTKCLGEIPESDKLWERRPEPIVLSEVPQPSKSITFTPKPGEETPR